MKKFFFVYLCVLSVFVVKWAAGSLHMSIQDSHDSWIYLDRKSGEWEKRIDAAQGVYQPIHWVALHRMQCMLRLMPYEGRIADIGCSYGILTLNVAAKKPRTQVVGIDPDADRLHVGEMLVKEHHLTNCRFQKGTLDAPGIEPESCAGVICTETLDHIPNVKPRLKEAVDKLMALLLPGGVALGGQHVIRGDEAKRLFAGGVLVRAVIMQEEGRLRIGLPP